MSKVYDPELSHCVSDGPLGALQVLDGCGDASQVQMAEDSGDSMGGKQVDAATADRHHAGRCALQGCDMLEDGGAGRYIPAWSSHMAVMLCHVGNEGCKPAWYLKVQGPSATMMRHPDGFGLAMSTARQCSC